MKFTKEQLEGIKKKIAECQATINELNEGKDWKNPHCGIDGFSDFDWQTKDQVEMTRTRMKELMVLLEGATEIVGCTDDIIDLGSRFEISVIYAEDDVDTLQATLVEKLEGVSVLDGYISVESPIGQAIYGKRPGDKFSFKVDDNGKKVTRHGIVNHANIMVEENQNGFVR